jgi:MurNAc alpha-1-phosphate uridylyltransferase
MDAALLLASREQSIGFEGRGDVFLADDGRLRFRGEASSAPYAYMGVHITKPQIVDDGPAGPFSLTPSWRRLADEGRLFGAVLDGFWMHVGDPGARDEAEAHLRQAAA